MLYLLPMLWWSAAARAGSPEPEPRCTPFDEAAFASAVASARALLDDENLGGFSAAARAIEARLPCLTAVPDPEVWAGHLVDVAVVAHFRGEDWRTPLATALGAWPEVDRGVGPEHEMATWAPEPASPADAPLPDRSEVYVDGVRADRLPDPAGLHLVQIRDDEGLRTLLLSGTPAPEGWLGSRPEPRDPALPYTLGLSLAGGGGWSVQVVAPDGDHIDDRSGPEIGGGGLAQLWIGRPVGLQVELSGPLAPRGTAAVGVRTGPVFAGLGGTVAGGGYRTQDGREGSPFAAPALALHAWFPAPMGGVDMGLIADGFPGVEASASARAAATVGRGGTRFRGGLSATVDRRWFLQVDHPGRTLSTLDWRILATAGLAWGAW